MAESEWKRLIKYIPTCSSIERYGEPLLGEHSILDIDDLVEKGILRARRLDGAKLSDLKCTDEEEMVHQICGLFSPKDVPIIRCIGLNYKTHILESGNSLPKYPVVFTKPSHSISGHNESIPVPKIAQSECDYEGELVIVIGKEGKNIAEEDALQHVAGYAVGNDISTRDWQRKTELAGSRPQWTFSKSFDKYAPVGPCIGSTQLLGEADSLDLQVRVNGQLRQKANTSDLCFGIRKLVSFCSQGQTLAEGSLIMTGTPGGIGLFMTPPTFLQNGDEIEVEIAGVGRLCNRIAFASS